MDEVSPLIIKLGNKDPYLQNKFLINVALGDAGLEVWIL